MKKLALVLLLAVVLSVGAFADHPSGWGVGLVGNFHNNWNGFGQNMGADNFRYGLSLKVPSVPVYWGGILRVNSWGLLLNATGDYYIYDKVLVPEIGLNWYLGVGGYLGFSVPDGGDLGLGFGARLPIGLSFQPIDMLEIFLDIAPSLGVAVTPEFDFPDGGLPVELGVRVWF